VINARKAGLAPSALSSWYHDPRDSEYGLLLGFTNLAADQAVEVMTRLKSVLGRPSASVSHRDVDPTSPYEGGTPSSPR
jgi:hypothetical protein